MLKQVASGSLQERLSIGTKGLSLDPEWAEPPIADIEVALLRKAAFPEVAKGNNLMHEFVILDPSTTRDTPGHEDLALRITATAERLKIPAVVIGHSASERFGTGGFPASIHELAHMSDRAFADAFAALRERIGWVLSSSRFSQERHILIPVFDGALLAVMVELLAQLPPVSRPYVHLATWWSEDDMPNLDRFGALERFGRAIHDLNGDRTTTFLYAWSRRLAQRLSARFGIPVQSLEAPPELSLHAEGERPPDRFTVGYFSSTKPESGFGQLASIIRATNHAARNPRRSRFVVQIKPDVPGGASRSAVMAQKAELAAIPERNVSLIEEFVPRPVYFAALKQVDAVLLPYTAGDGQERFSTVAQHAMAAGKLVFTYDGVTLPGTVKNRVLTARDDRVMGEIIADTAADLPAVRTAASVAKATYWGTLRPSRLFAQLLYGPLILASANGADSV